MTRQTIDEERLDLLHATGIAAGTMAEKAYRLARRAMIVALLAVALTVGMHWL